MFHLPRRMMIKKRREFQRVYAQGKSYANRYLVLYVFPAAGLGGKVGFAAGKKLGCAPKRNRAKRLLRECYRLHQAQLREGWACLLVARRNLIQARFQDAEKAYLSLLRRAKIYTREHIS